MKTVPELIDALGGNTTFGRICGFEVNPSARAGDMRRRGSVPVRYWDRIIGKITKDEQPVTLEMLHSLHREAAA